MPQLEQLPVEILWAISDHLDPRSVARLGQTSRTINGKLQHALASAARQYALPDEAEYKQRITFNEDGKGIRSLERTYSLTPQRLVHAIYYHHFNKVKNYLEAGVDPNTYDLDGHRMLSLAVRAKDEPIVDLLLEHGADPALNDVCPPYTSPVVDASDDEMVKKLLSIGSDFTQAGGIPALAGRCSLDVIKLAIGKGADFRQITHDGSTVIHHAATNTDHPDVLEFFIGRYPELLSSRTTEGETALWSAISEFSAELGKTLITAGIDINVRDHLEGKTALHAALNFSQRALYETMEYVAREKVEECLSIATALLERGIHVGIVDRWGYTELHHTLPLVPTYKDYLREKRMPSVVRLLVSRSTVNVNATDHRGWTPLHLAATAGWLRIVRVLVEEGNADVNQTDNYGRTPADLARAFPAVFDYLSRRAAN